MELKTVIIDVSEVTKGKLAERENKTAEDDPGKHKYLRTSKAEVTR